MDPVIVVGAGPTGLALSLALARHSVPSLVLDATDGRAEPRAARTCVLRPDTASHLPSGLPGLRWHSWRTQRRRQLVERVVLDEEDAPLHVEQHALEGALRDALENEPLARIVTGSHVDVLEQDPRGVTAHTRGPRGTWWRGSYAVGCDGARSTVRKLLGVRFPGHTSVERHAVATLRVRLPWENEALLHRDPGGRQGEVTARPLAGDKWRLDWLLPPRGELVTPEQMLERIQDTLALWFDEGVPGAVEEEAEEDGAASPGAGAGAGAGSGRPSAGGRTGRAGRSDRAGRTGRAGRAPGPYELLDTGVHTAHQRLARQWRIDRTFLAGDAAHVLGALGIQSVDEGLRDAANLAWKLALAWHHGHDAAAGTLLDSYEAERRGAVVARLRAVDQALPVVRRGGGLRGLLPGSARAPLGLLTDGHVGRGLLGAPATYTRTRLAPARNAVGSVPVGTAPGAPVRDIPVTALDGTRGRLRDWLCGAGGELVVVLIAPGTGVWDSRHWLSAGVMPELAAAVDGLPLRSRLLVAENYPGAGAHTVLVVRADGHLVTALPAVRPAQLRVCADAVRGGAVTAEQ